MAESISKILIIDNDPTHRSSLEAVLSSPQYVIFNAPYGEGAINIANTHDFNLIIIGQDSLVGSGFETASLLRNVEITSSIPILFISDQISTEEFNFVGFDAGPVDILCKPVTPKLLLQKVALLLDYQRKNNALLESNETAGAILNACLDEAYLIAPNGEIFGANSIAASRSLPHESNLVGTNIQDIFSEETRQKRFQKIKEVIRTGNPLSFEDQQGESIFKIQVYPVLSVDKQVQKLAVIIADITKNRQAEDLLARMAKYDPLTGMANRSMLTDFQNQAMARAKRHKRNMAVLYFGLDRLKDVNDSLGREVGDKLLRSVAERIEKSLRTSDLVSRVGGDEFVLIVDDIAHLEDAAYIADKIVESMEAPHIINGHEIVVTGSIGVALYSGGAETSEELNKAAETAMYHAKQQGRSNFQFFSPDMQQKVIERMQLANDLRLAINNDQLLVHYQPQVEAGTGRVVGLEALLRWNHHEFGMVSPARFIPLAEETRMINSIGEWVLRTACGANHALCKAIAGSHSISVAVNVSIRQLKQEHFCDTIKKVLDETGLPAQHLEIELTESTVMEDAESAIKMLSEIRALGVKISIDDFGTGYSSLSYLKQLPIDAVKIDLSFVRDIGKDSNTEAIIRAIICLAHNLGLKVVAEGVETLEQANFLAEHECEYLQGYYFSRPLDHSAAVRLLSDGIVLGERPTTVIA